VQPAEPTAAPGQAGVGEDEAEVAPAVRYDEGPLRGAVVALYDARFWFAEGMPGGRESSLQMRVRVWGEKITGVVRYGMVIFDEAADDTGKSLVGPETYTEEERTQMRPANQPAEFLREHGLILAARVDTPNRAAQTVKLRGSARLILAPEQEEITIDNPLQYLGKTLDHKRLTELGIEVRLVPAEEIADTAPPPTERMPILEYVKGRDRVNKVSFHDAEMKERRHRERPMKTKDDKAVVGYAIVSGALDENSQLVLQVFPEIEEVRVPVEAEALKLP
jgi:hypothetical protein